MSKPIYRRPLDSSSSVSEFVNNVLVPYAMDHDDDPLAKTIMDSEGRSKIVKQIATAEILVNRFESESTDSQINHRDSRYKTDTQRKNLHQQILSELIFEQRLTNDNEIKLGYGGACPPNVQSNSQAFIVMGSPASGKSGIAEKLADRHGAFMVDSDYAKRKFPEFSDNIAGASLVHRESDSIVFNPDNSLFQYCVCNGHNITIPLVGRTFHSVEGICNVLARADYDVHIIDVALERQICVWRALKRYLDTNRYVPLAYVFDEVGNEPERIYYILKRTYGGRHRRKHFKGFTQLSNDVVPGSAPVVVEQFGTNIWG